MASPSRDGEFIAEVARGLGFAICSGSRRKGGVQALQPDGRLLPPRL